MNKLLGFYLYGVIFGHICWAYILLKPFCTGCRGIRLRPVTQRIMMEIYSLFTTYRIVRGTTHGLKILFALFIYKIFALPLGNSRKR
jgi:hypothetical protein